MIDVLKNKISALFMLAFVVIGFCLSVQAIYESRDKLAVQGVTQILQGKWASLYEKEFDKSILTRDFSVDFWGTLSYFLFHHGKDGVVIGKDGFLFTSEEFDYIPHAKDKTSENLQFMADVQATLKAKNIDLFIALVPSKSRIYDDKLAPYYIPDYFKDRYDTTLQNIQKAGIQVIDLRTALSKAQHDSFLKTDTHWTPYGARRAAQEIANTVAQQSQTFKTGDQYFETKPTKQQSHEGDLLRYVPLLPVLANQKPALDTLEIMKTISIGTQSKDIDLFGESSLPVTLVGTSYSANNLWNFSGYLKEALQSDLLNAAEEGKGPFTPMKNYLESDQFKNATPKLIIWEIPERFLPMNYDLKKDTQNTQIKDN